MASFVWSDRARRLDEGGEDLRSATTRLAVMTCKRRKKYRDRACLCCRLLQRSVWCLSRDKTKSPVAEKATMSCETYRSVHQCEVVRTTA